MRRRGVTLIELMVAMLLAGIATAMVAGWIVHSAALSGRSQARDDREQELSLLRSSAFQDGTRGHPVSVRRDGWSVELSASDPPRTDTVSWDASGGFVRRSGRILLPSDTVVESTLLPRLPGADPAQDPWPGVDQDLDGEVDAQWLPRLASLEWVLVVRHRDFPGKGTIEDTLRISVPLMGPG